MAKHLHGMSLSLVPLSLVKNFERYLRHGTDLGGGQVLIRIERAQRLPLLCLLHGVAGALQANVREGRGELFVCFEVEANTGWEMLLISELLV